MTSIRSSGLPHLRLVGPYKLSFEPDGSPLFTSTPLVACWRYEPREHLRPLAKTRPLIPPSPLSDRVGYSDHVRFRGYFPVHCIPAYNLPVYASQWPLPEHHARLGTRLLARLCRGRHRRRQTSTRLQGATLNEPSRRWCFSSPAICSVMRRFCSAGFWTDPWTTTRYGHRPTWDRPGAWRSAVSCRRFGSAGWRPVVR